MCLVGQMIVSHRINTIEQIEKLNPDEAIEFDVRDSNGKCIVEHDAFQIGLDFETFLKAVGKRFLLVNIKSEGIEMKVLELLKFYNIHNFFLFDCSFPKIIELANMGERRIGVRFSEYETIETVMSLKNKIEWVWVDSFEVFSMTKEIMEKIKNAGMKMCLVSPDLHKKPEEIASYINSCIDNSFFFDAVCCKQHNRHLWEEYYVKIKRPIGFLVYHQGWTDIINSSALIHYYTVKYNKLYIMIKTSSLELHKYITRSYKNIDFINIGEENHENTVCSIINNIRLDNNNLFIKENDVHLIGLYDKFKLDSSFNSFVSLGNGRDFVRKFYIAYNIPFIVRVNYFSIERDFEKENALYQNIVKTDSYTVTHLKETNNIQIKKDYLNSIAKNTSYELNGICDCMFDAIKILEKANEMHLIDSVWAAVCYHLDVKYRLFKDIPIIIHCLRGHKLMFQEPILLPNWKFIDYEV
jgi:hypothetical protein